MEKQNNNLIFIIKTCIITSVVYVFLNKIIEKVIVWYMDIMYNSCIDAIWNEIYDLQFK